MNAFFTKRALNEFIKRCASYSKQTVHNCKRTRTFTKSSLSKNH